MHPPYNTPPFSHVPLSPTLESARSAADSGTDCADEEGRAAHLGEDQGGHVRSEPDQPRGGAARDLYQAE